jgi:hypothetical protein
MVANTGAGWWLPILDRHMVSTQPNSLAHDMPDDWSRMKVLSCRQPLSPPSAHMCVPCRWNPCFQPPLTASEGICAFQNGFVTFLQTFWNSTLFSPTRGSFINSRSHLEAEVFPTHCSTNDILLMTGYGWD